MNTCCRMLPACLCALLLSWSAPSNSDTTIIIGTASPAGVYHLAGRALCRTVDLPCRAEPSDGSSANLHAVRRGEVTLALVQSDLHHYATTGSEGFREVGPDATLRSVFSLHSEPFTLVARRDAGIRHLEDLAGRSINIGNPGSGQRGTMMKVMDARGWSRSSFRQINDLPADQQALELCHGNIDAMVYTVGHPNSSVAQAIRLCNAVLVDVEGAAIELLITAYPFFTRASIPGGLYSPDQPAVRTFGVRATLVASSETDPEIIYRLVASVFDNLLRFKAYHPAFGTLTAASMIEEGLSAPLHEGALRYYHEQGWIMPREDQPGPIMVEDVPGELPEVSSSS